MKLTVEGQPKTVEVDGQTYEVETKGMRGDMRVQMTFPRSRSFTSPEYVMAATVTELKNRISTWNRTTQAEKEEKKTRQQAQKDTPVRAIHGTRRVQVRGYHATSGQMLITYEDTGEKGAVSESSLSPSIADINRIEGLYQVRESVQEAMKRLAHNFYDITRDLSDVELVVTYRPETDDYTTQYGKFTAIGAYPLDVVKKIERQVQNDKLPWTIDNENDEKEDRIIRTEFLDSLSFHNGFETKEAAESYMKLENQEDELQAEIIDAQGKFDYAAELKKAKEAS